jgi:hypothetical protein
MGGHAQESYPRDFLRLLRVGHSPAHRECDGESKNPCPFSILDFGFWIVGKRIPPSHPKSSIHSLAPNPKSKIGNPKFI